MIQEHWLLLPEHLGALNNISNEFLSIGVSGMDSGELLTGCPYGGCGILYRKLLSPFISRLNCCSNRFCAVNLTLPTSNPDCSQSILLVNVYLPTDYGTVVTNNAFLDCLGELDGFISAQPFDNIICGDFNVDFSRNSHQLVDFMNTHNLVRADSSTNIQFTYRRDDLSVTSWPDHVLTLPHCLSQIPGVSCLDDADNIYP